MESEKRFGKIKKGLNVLGEYSHIIHNATGFLLKIQSPEFSTRRIFGKDQPSPEDEALTTLFIKDNKGIRLLMGMAGLLSNHMDSPISASEKIGITYLIDAVINCDGYIDNLPVFEGLSKDELRRQLFIQPVMTHRKEFVKKPDNLEAITIGELVEKAKDHVAPDKRGIIDDLFDNLLDAHNSYSRLNFGEYTYRDVTDYREKTNSECIQALADLMGIKDTNIVREYKDAVQIGQLLDDIGDFIEDGQKGNHNLFLGLAKDLSQNYPKEFESLSEIIANKTDKMSPEEIKEILKKDIPNIYREYMQGQFFPLLKSFSDRELRFFAQIIRQVSRFYFKMKIGSMS